jgi:hypothetical protein
MILRRLSQSLKEQNWTAIWIEFILLVSGVFLGIQVSNWNAERQNDVEASRFLGRLEAEFAQQIARTDRGIASHTQSLQASKRLIDGIRSGVIDDDHVIEDIGEAASYTTPPGPSTVFQEFVSTGQTQLIRSDPLRSALYEYNGYVTFVQSQYDSITAPILQANNALMRAQTIEATGIPSKDFNQLAAIQSVDTSILLKDPEIIHTLQINYITHDNIQVVLAKIRERMLAIQTLIKAEQDRAK